MDIHGFSCDHYRYENAEGAFLYPLYGQGELPQAFSRLAAVKGALYVSMS
jgi:RAB protein geranylgeranyltransferase component A